jgi:hypothetical protein
MLSRIGRGQVRGRDGCSAMQDQRNVNPRLRPPGYSTGGNLWLGWLWPLARVDIWAIIGTFPHAAEAIVSSTSRAFSLSRALPWRRNGRNTPRQSGQRNFLKTQRRTPARVQHARALSAGAGWVKGSLPGFLISTWQTHCAGLRTAGSRTSTVKAQAGSRN